MATESDTWHNPSSLITRAGVFGTEDVCSAALEQIFACDTDTKHHAIVSFGYATDSAFLSDSRSGDAIVHCGES
jgi:hypothetical protein